ncbi:MAG: hypothetical protein WKF57_05800 [Nakamurella sp.]
MTRIPAPSGDADLDLALREAADQWRLDFEVPPMPLLDSGSQPLGSRAPTRLRWTRPVLVAASIVLLAAAASVVVSTARADRDTAGAPSSAANTTSKVSVPQRSRTWPVAQAGGPLVVQVGSPPASITLGGTTMALLSTGSSPWVVVDSERPNFVRIFGSRDLGGDCCSATWLYLDQSAPGTVTVTLASYGPELKGQTCPAFAHLGGPLDGEAPFPMAGQKRITGSTGDPVQTVDLTDYRAPQYVPAGFILSAWVTVQSVLQGSPREFFVRRAIAPPPGPSATGISLTWQRADAENPVAAVRPSWSQVDLCASRLLARGISVSACDTSQDPQHAIPTAELRRVVDSIPN